MVKRISRQGNDDLNADTQNMSYVFIEPANHPKRDFYIPPEFEERVLVHIVNNFLAHVCGINIPLILAIQGPQGDGKSSQVREVCSRHGIHVYPISGSFLSGSHEKEAVDILAKSYINAQNLAKKIRDLVVILIDDFDLSVASTFEEREYTVNSQLLTGFMMNLADDPTKCGQQNVDRIPIIITGNNFTSLYAPLTRHGRMDFFSWFPTDEQKAEIVKYMYKSCIREQEISKILQLVEEYRDEPISFFDSLKSDYLNAVIGENIKRLRQVNMRALEQVAISAFSQGINIDFLRELAAQRKAIQRKDYIQHSARMGE